MTSPTEKMAPIPLRTLVLLLNYERMASDPRFEHLGLQYSTAARDYSKQIKDYQWPGMFKDEPRSVDHTWLHQFTRMNKIVDDPFPATVAKLHEKAYPHASQQGNNERERVYHHVRSCGEGFNSACLLQYFLDLCPPEQELGIQIKDEQPVLIQATTTSRRYMKFLIHNPQSSFAISQDQELIAARGKENDEAHYVFGLPHPEEPENVDRMYIIDMSRLQFYEPGRGNFGENYYVGSYEDYKKSMRKVCDRLIEEPDVQGRLFDSRQEERLRGCALKVWNRWSNRANEGWCSFCGRGGLNLRLCQGCRDGERRVLYCNSQHQKLDFQLHKLTCAITTRKR